MQVTSRSQRDAERSGRIPAVETIRDGVLAIPLALPGPIRYSFCYSVLDSNGSVHLIDAGYDTDENWSALVNGLAGVGRTVADVASITITHYHPDHLGMAGRIREASGARVAMHTSEAAAVDSGLRTPPVDSTERLTSWGVPADRLDELSPMMHVAAGSRGVEVDVRLVDGQRLEVPGRALQVVHTPGHTTGHVCIRDVGALLLYSGDHVLPTIYPGLGLGGPSDSNPLMDYLESLDRVAVFDGDEVLPGHGYRFQGLAERCAQVGAHHLRRASEVADILARDGNSSTWNIASRLTWSAGWPNLPAFHRLSALIQTEIHVDYVLLRRPDARLV